LIFNHPVTLSMCACRNDLNPSEVQSSYFGLLDCLNTVVTTLAGRQIGGFSNATGGLAIFSNPQGICVGQNGTFLVADTGNNAVRTISQSGQTSTLAGTGIAGSQLGSATNAQFSGPTSVCIDRSGNVFVADENNCNRICKIDTNGMVSVFAYRYADCIHGPSLWQLESDLAGNVYVGSWVSVQKINPTGDVSKLGGPGWCCPDGWSERVGVGVDAATNIYAATSCYVWTIAPDGITDLYAGSIAGYSDGSRFLARFQAPLDTDVDRFTNVVVSDATRIRVISRDGWVSTLAGTGEAGYRNGRGSQALFNVVTGLCVDTNGNILVADSGNNCIRKISPDSAGIGIADDWQRAHFGCVGINPKDDPDHDGASNFTEFWAGTNPQDAHSVLAIDSHSICKSGQIQIRWQTVAGKAYTVEYSSDLFTWTHLGNPIQGDGTVASVYDPTAISENIQRHYRVTLTGF
jgi:hypothetical protein